MTVVTVARKPLAAGSVAASALSHATGALHIDATRIDGGGRWPANLVLQHLIDCRPGECATGCPVAWLDADAGPTGSWSPKTRPGGEEHEGQLFGRRREGAHYGDFGGGASRFFKQVGWRR